MTLTLMSFVWLESKINASCLSECCSSSFARANSHSLPAMRIKPKSAREHVQMLTPMCPNGLCQQRLPPVYPLTHLMLSWVCCILVRHCQCCFLCCCLSCRCHCCCSIWSRNRARCRCCCSCWNRRLASQGCCCCYCCCCSGCGQW